MLVFSTGNLKADPVDFAEKVDEVPKHILDSLKSMAIQELQTFSGASRDRVYENIDVRMKIIRENTISLSQEAVQELDAAYEVFLAVPTLSQRSISAVEVLELIYWIEEDMRHSLPLLSDTVMALRCIRQTPDEDKEPDGASNSEQLLLDPYGGIDDFLLDYKYGQSWRVWPYPEPPTVILFWAGTLIYHLSGQNVGLIFKSKGPYTYIDVFEQGDIVWPHEIDVQATVGSGKTVSWLVNLTNTQGNYSTNLKFEMWWDRAWPIPNELSGYEILQLLHRRWPAEYERLCAAFQFLSR